MPLSLRRGGPADAAVIVAFNQAMARESEGKALDPEVLGAGVRAALADPGKGFYFLAEEVADWLRTAWHQGAVRVRLVRDAPAHRQLTFGGEV